jgi:hypothetical protein
MVNCILNVCLIKGDSSRSIRPSIVLLTPISSAKAVNVEILLKNRLNFLIFTNIINLVNDIH